MKIKLARQFLALYLLLAIIGQGIYLPSAAAALGNTGTISIRVQVENSAPLGITNLNAITINRWDDPITSTGSIKLAWTAPKDLPNNDQVFSYIIKYATFSIENLAGDTTAWWNHSSVKTIVSQDLNSEWGIHSSASPGGNEILILSGLIPGEYYWFSAKAVDKYNNKSDLDSLSNGTATQPEAYASTSKDAPGNISTLVASPETGTLGRINLSWVAKGNDGDSGKIVDGKYRIMYSTVNSPEFNNEDDKYNPEPKWPGATSIYLSTSNVLPGTSRCYTIDNLNLQTTYFFRLWVADEWYYVDKSTWNWSLDSNISSAIPYPESPPGPVMGFSAIAYASTDTAVGSYVKLQWTNPTTNYTQWPFEGVKICSSTIVSAITDYPKWTDSDFVTLTGLVSGTTGEFTFNHLIPRTSYFYSIYAFDKASRPSARTTGYAFTSPDIISPEPPIGLSILADADTTNGSYVKLNWTNPDTSKYQNADWNKIRIFVSTSSYPAGPAQGSITSLERTLAITTTGYVFAALPPQLTYYFSVFNYDGGNNGSSATASVYIWEDVVPPAPVVIINPDLSPTYSLDISSGCMLKLSIKLPPGNDLLRLYVTGREDRYPVSQDDGYPDLSDTITNLIPDSTLNITKTELIGNTTYYFGLFLVDWSGNVSSQSASGIVIVPSNNTVPLIPQCLRPEKSGDDFTLRWKRANYKFSTGDPDVLMDISTSSPKTTDIYRYQVYESSGMKEWKLVKRLKPYEEQVYAAAVNAIKFYKVRAINIAGEYSESMIADSNDEPNYYFIGPEGSRVKFPNALALEVFEFEKANAGDLYVEWSELKGEENGPVVKSFKVEPRIISDCRYVSASGFKFSRPETAIMLSYGDLSGAQNPAAKSISEPEKWLSNFYFNGREWLKLPSVVDTKERFVTSKVKFLGAFQIRVARNATDFTLYKVFPKIITPNKDGTNDQAVFQFENPRVSALGIKIFDITGALVKDLGMYNADSYVGGTLKTWDGTDANGDVVPPGTYIYQIESEGKVYNGTIIVAR
jgi:hypothetical protein